jgi:hypothetical protein
MTTDQTLLNENQSAIAPAHVTQAHFDEWGIGTREIARSATHSTSAIGEVL